MHENAGVTVPSDEFAERRGGRGRRPLALAVESLLLLGALAFFALLKSYSLAPALSDENIYFYDAWLMAQGFVPYRDFFFAHPPLHLVPGWLLVVSMGGFDLTALKLLAPVAAGVSGVCVYATLRRVAGFPAAWAGMSLFLFSHDLLRASSHWTGVNQALAWLCLGVLAALAARAVAAGVLFALGVCTGVYVAPGAAVCVLLLWLARRRDGLRCAAAALVTGLAVNLLFFALGDDGYLDGVYRYHLLKPAAAGAGMGGALGELLFHDFFVLAPPLYAAPLLLREARRRRRAGEGLRALLDPARHPRLATGLWCMAIWLVGLLFLALQSRVFHYYFLIVFPAAAVCGGLFVQSLLEELVAAFRALRSGGSGRALGGAGRPTGAAALMLASLVAGFLLVPRFEHALPYFEKNRGRTRRYRPPPSPLPEALQWLPGWREERVIGERYSGVQYYLWHEGRSFEEAFAIAEAVARSAAPGDRIFGDSVSTPLVSLLSGVEIADRFSDTNAMRFEAGLPTPEQAIARLEAAMERKEEPLVWLLLNPRRGVARVEPLRRFFDARFETVRSFPTRHHGTFRLMRRRGTPEAQPRD